MTHEIFFFPKMWPTLRCLRISRENQATCSSSLRRFTFRKRFTFRVECNKLVKNHDSKRWLKIQEKINVGSKQRRRCPKQNPKSRRSKNSITFMLRCPKSSDAQWPWPLCTLDGGQQHAWMPFKKKNTPEYCTSSLKLRLVSCVQERANMWHYVCVGDNFFLHYMLG